MKVGTYKLYTEYKERLRVIETETKANNSDTIQRKVA